MKITSFYSIFFVLFFCSQIVLSMQSTPEQIQEASAGKPLYRTYAIHPGLLADSNTASAGKSLCRTQAIHPAPRPAITSTIQSHRSNVFRRTDQDTIDSRFVPLVIISMGQQDDIEVSPTGSPKRTLAEVRKEQAEQAEQNKKDGFNK